MVRVYGHDGEVLQTFPSADVAQPAGPVIMIGKSALVITDNMADDPVPFRLLGLAVIENISTVVIDPDDMPAIVKNTLTLVQPTVGDFTGDNEPS